MPRKPDVPCAGGCGKLLYGGKGALPPGVRTCRDCRRSRRTEKQVRLRDCGACGAPTSRPKYCSDTCARRGFNALVAAGLATNGDPGRRKARNRAKVYRRRANARYGDVTLAYEQELRRKARRCPLCKVQMTDEPYEYNSKELDHLIPLAVGGTHTVGNVRIICRACNQGRPYDGSDYVGPVTLWAEQPGFVVAETRGGPARVCEHGVRTGYFRCWQCRPRMPSRREADGRRAAVLRADGWAWKDIAAHLGMLPSNVAKAARTWGEPDTIAQWPLGAQCLRCGVGLRHRTDRGAPRKYCQSCRPSRTVMR